MVLDRVALIFPGQGAQYVGMGKDFFDRYPTARQVFEEADDVLGRSLSTIIFEGPEELLTETHNSQPGIFVVSMALLKVIEEQFPSLRPQFAAGLSLGEYSALCAARTLSFKEALELVQKRAQFMNEACLQHKGTMAVILGLEPEVVETLKGEGLWVANYNCPGQIVISGTPAAIEKASKTAKDRGAKRVLPLSVQGAFHSGLMQSASDKLAERIHNTSFKEPSLSLAMNVPGGFVQGVDHIKRNLITQVTHSVRWESDVRAIEAEKPSLYLEIGPGKTLAGMNRKIAVQAPTVSVEKVEDLEGVYAASQ